jgi:pimeloyl-ACP methyl ester carboxylesterase
VNNAFKSRKPEQFNNTPMHLAYNSVAPDRSKWIKLLEQMFALGSEPYNMGEDNIARISSPVLLIAGDNDGLDKIELIKTYRLLGGAVAGDFGGMPRSQLAILPSQGHRSLMMETQILADYIDRFLTSNDLK